MKSIFNIAVLVATILWTSTTAIAQSENQTTVETTDTTFIVNGVCEMCKHKIETAAKLEGVEKTEWDVESKVLRLSFNAERVSLAEISTAINKSGYDTEFSAAAEEDYQKLHKCCHYRDPAVINAH